MAEGGGRRRQVAVPAVALRATERRSEVAARASCSAWAAVVVAGPPNWGAAVEVVEGPDSLLEAVEGPG